MAKEQKAKNFTYDYDGKVILVHGLKNEKFPPATYLIKLATYKNIIFLIINTIILFLYYNINFLSYNYLS